MPIALSNFDNCTIHGVTLVYKMLDTLPDAILNFAL